VRREVTPYTRRNCSLCDEAAAELRSLAAQLRFAIRELDIDEDASLRERYDAIVPVIAVGERVIARAPIAAGELRAALEEALG
jgi:glutaredoxin